MGQLQRAASDAVDSRLMGMPEGGQAVIPGLRLGEEEGPSQRTNAANVGASVPRTYPRSLNETSRWTSLGHSTEQSESRMQARPISNDDDRGECRGTLCRPSATWP